MTPKIAMDTDLVNINQGTQFNRVEFSREEKNSSTKEDSRGVDQGSNCRDSKPLGRGVYQQSFSGREKR